MAALAFSAAAWAASDVSSSNARPSASIPPGDAERGEELGAQCLACHGENAPLAASSPVPPPHLYHQRQNAVFYALLDYREGRRNSAIMEPFVQTLSDQDIRDLAAFLAGPEFDEPPKPAFAGTPLHELAVKQCSLCHGETGMGEMDGMPILTGQDAAYLEHALAEYRNGGRTEPTMRAVAKALDPSHDADLARYYSAQKALEPSK